VSDMVLRMLRIALPTGEAAPTDGHALILLQAVGGFHAYLRAVTAPPNAQPVARFLLFERAYRAWPATPTSMLPASSRCRGRTSRRSAACRSQDFVHLSLVLLRRRGIAARYVSGYLWAAPKDEGADSVEVDTHAWLEVLLPADGRQEEPVWVGADPTNRRLAGRPM
jgi:hypothetical protein